ncbi:FtsQ-type POTRA domain-containing protein [Microbacterium sp. Se63.02b]|uniref:FtsQ-type POTRA domain-containing protein n=1 Tax=Microbacterium sp. Se63.02b TaxID=2709304 RepID=UPI001604F06D|nr:FtsQ-type POTRA domain-containing protein [Microbacterium sp. Se63.02b]QNA92916.1 FtsQ-type POTRA domain-containing protein [Microbacterium sp. Se63.02b]QYM63075.1 FtsQ-type POTRA domain-containing protein [Microbacterium sp. Se5.02b]
MRRPAPLPNNPEKEAAPEATRPPRRGAGAADEVPTLQSALQDDASADVSSTDAASPDGTQPTSTRDVWRAARARRKALRSEIRRFTQRSRRRRIVWLGGIGAVVVLIGGSVAAAYSPLFAVQKITVVGAASLDPAAVEAALSDQLGTPLALVDTSEVKASLLAFPLIETYALEARPPHDLTVRIVERTPVGVIRSSAGYTLVDAAGVALSTTAEQPAGQPLIDIDGGVDSKAFQSAGLVVRSLPDDIRATLSGVRATTPDDVTLTLSTGMTVVWGSAEESALKALTLSAAMVKNPDAASIDVTSPDVAVVG